MDYLTLNNGVQMPVFGLGTWDLRGSECLAAIPKAVELGYRLIDTAQMYQNEKEVGRAVRACGIPRKELFITTKIYRPDTDYKKAKKAIERSLLELQVDYIDLLLIHEPYKTAGEMYPALEEAYQAGKVRAIGISNFSEEGYLDFIKNCHIIPAINQVESHVYFPQKQLMRTMEEYGTKMQAWAPFTEGRRKIFEEPVLTDVGKKYGKSAAQTALRYLIQNGIGVIAKSSHTGRLKENIAIFDFELEPDDMSRIDMLDEGKSLFGWY